MSLLLLYVLRCERFSTNNKGIFFLLELILIELWVEVGHKNVKADKLIGRSLEGEWIEWGILRSFKIEVGTTWFIFSLQWR